MREIREKITELTAVYGRQLGLYQQIRKVGSQEEALIQKGQLDRLLQVLQEKEALLKEAGGYELQIKTIQDLLMRHFKLTEFSLPQLKLVAATYYQQDLRALEEAIAQLVPILELLEDQERQNEEFLTQYLEKNRKPVQINKQQAHRVYGQKKV